MNKQQIAVLTNWSHLLWQFTKREFQSILLWSALGVLAAGLGHLLGLDKSFQTFVKTKYVPPTSRFDDTRLYFLYILTIMMAVTAIAATRIPEIASRGFRSWRVGVTSGLCFLPFASTFLTLILGHGTLKDQLLTDLAVITICYAIGYCLYLKGRVDVEKTLSESDLRVPQHQRQTNKTELLESDDPIETWAQDALGRAALVDTISIKLMISKTPVLALFGEFGSGKTSILNLLRRNLENKAIVVSFSTWLPGSQETLTSYLLADIATECQKQYIVPGLRKSAERFASALAQSVPVLKGYPELFPAATQRDDIESVRAALSRLPKRVIVLLDELDRMEKNELLTLLKVIRGTAALPNLSFVCASNREAIAETVKGEFNDKSNLYFEKFFPVSVQIPKPDREALCEAGIERLVAVFNGRGWFEHDAELESFRRQINAVWEGRIAPFCHNLRAIGLLANDVGTAAAPLRREVHPVDLTLIELLHRFKPSIYEIVEKNFVTLTGGQGLLKGGSYVSDQEKERLKKKLLEDIHKEAGGDEQFQQVTGVLKELFPNSLPRFEGSPTQRLTRYGEEESGESSDKRIFHPGIFPAYFRYELPRAMYSSAELEAFLRKVDASPGDVNRQITFVRELNSMEKGSPKRDDFLLKLSNAVEYMSPQVAQALVYATMKAADKYVYDTVFLSFGEAGHVLRIVIRVAEKTSQSERAKLLSDCITEATDDTMALRIVTRLTGKQNDFDLRVSFAQLYPAFIERMRKRYGRDVDALKIDLKTADSNAFSLWGSSDPDPKNHTVTVDPEDRAIQHDFWLSYIGNSRLRLARAFEMFFMPFGIYEGDPTPIIEQKISAADLGRLFSGLPDDEGPTAADRKSLQRLQRFLSGEFKNGFQPDFDRPSSQIVEETTDGTA